MPVLAITYTSLTAAGESDLGPVCPSCGSANVIAVQWHGGSGVVAPDGNEECRMQCGMKCLNCAAIEEE
jgi:hypothetical protein